MIKRRDFLASLAALPLLGCHAPPPLPEGLDLSSGHLLGHRLREGLIPKAPTEKRQTGIAIIGGGISGLAAGWWLQRNGFEDFLVLEMNDQPGGNSRAGQAAPGHLPFPLGAHYLPLPSPEARYVRELLSELGTLQGSIDAQKPHYDENRLCAQPQERIYRQGLWEEGLLPHLGISPASRTEYQRFSEMMQQLKHQHGRDGKRVFALPMALSSDDPAWRALDQQTFHDWLIAQQFNEPALHWLANYACRDDYGTDYRQTSAWAGLHYFACRIGEAANAQNDCVLTAPEGNAWLMEGLARPLQARVETHRLVAHLQIQKQRVTVDVLNGQKNTWSQIEARHVIWASPHFLLPKVWPGLPKALLDDAATPTYAPWLVSNVHLDHPLPEKHGTPLAWDNILYEGETLGYVVNHHQKMRRYPGPSVLTCYRTFDTLTPAAARQQLLNTPADTWKARTLAELRQVYPDLPAGVSRIDLFRHGHAMARPTPGTLFNSARERLSSLDHRFLSLAHADLSGFSLFEEAQYRGVEAAAHALRRLGFRPRT